MIARVLLVLIRLYQLAISPLFGNVCRFEPSCSRYAAACIGAHGAARGSLLSAVRLCKCHPFHPGGFDPPPAQFPRLRDLFFTRRGSRTAPQSPEPLQVPTLPAGEP